MQAASRCAALNVLDFDLVPAHAERPKYRHLVGELIDQLRLGAVAEGHFAPGFDLIRDLFEQVAMAGVMLFSEFTRTNAALDLVIQIALPLPVAHHPLCTLCGHLQQQAIRLVQSAERLKRTK